MPWSGGQRAGSPGRLPFPIACRTPIKNTRLGYWKPGEKEKVLLGHVFARSKPWVSHLMYDSRVDPPFGEDHEQGDMTKTLLHTCTTGPSLQEGTGVQLLDSTTLQNELHEAGFDYEMYRDMKILPKKEPVCH